jgi:methyl-accepting chemotaxis protein
MDLNEAIKAHSEWKMRLRSALSHKETLDAATIGRDDCCKFGKWLHGEARGQFGALRSHADCVHKHAAFHREAGKVAATINDARYDEADAMLKSQSSYSLASNDVLFAIGALKKEAGL